jgi:hypothetical protein
MSLSVVSLPPLGKSTSTLVFLVINTTSISGLLFDILGVVLFLVEGLLVLVVELIVPYGDHCKFIKFTNILVILRIKLFFITFFPVLY